MQSITKQLLTIMFLFIYFFSKAQIVDIDYSKKTRNILDSSTTRNENNIQFLKNGFVDFLSDGNIQASARLLRINIGDRNKFYLPFFIYTGTAGNAFGGDKLNKTTVSNLLNPIGGTINLSFNGLQNLIKGESVTKLKFAYQLGGRTMNGKDSLTQENVNFFNGFANLGLFFQTGAWTPDDPSNMGIFYIQAKLISSFSSNGNLQKIFGNSSINKGYLLGYSIDAGIEINKVINVKLGVYQYTNNSGIALLKDPIVKFSLDYSLKK